MRDRFFLYRRIDDDTFEFGRFDRFRLHSSVNRGLQQLFNTGFTNGSAKATDLRGIARQLRCVVRLPAEILPDHILGPAHHQFFVTEVKCVFQVQQGNHQSNRQARPPCSARSSARNHQRRSKKIADFHYFTLTVLTLESWRKRCFDLEATAVDLPTPPRDGADRSSGLSEREKSHKSAF